MSRQYSVPAAFQAMADALEITSAQRERANGQQKHLRGVLDGRVGLSARRPTFLTGSFARGTAVRRLEDIDLFAVLDPSRYGHLSDALLREALGIVAEALGVAYPGAVDPVLQEHSVRIDFGGSHPASRLSFDVVPALPRDDGGYWIPRQSAGGWIASDPDRHAAVTTAANRRTRGMASRLTKMVKLFAREAGGSAKVASFHLEMMVCELLQQPPVDLARGLHGVFAGLADRVTRPFADPARIGPAIDERLTAADRARLRLVFEAAADESAEALRLDADDLDGAHWLWRKLLGHRYPEAGRKPQAGTAPRRAPGIDAEGSRFG